ncbi:MAG TPA: hypothetical protein VFZ77_20900 [Acidimicrobiales bacterium]
MTGAAPRRGDRASVLVLVPAALLVVLVMASIAVDMSLVHLRRRQAHDLAAGAANDAAAAAADPGGLRQGDVFVDPERAQDVVDRVVAASTLAPELAAPPAVRVAGDVVVVEISLYADYVFAGVIPGAPDGTTVTAAASATLVAGP